MSELEAQEILAEEKAIPVERQANRCHDRQHIWTEPSAEGDTCECGRWYRFDGHIEATADDALEDITSDCWRELCEGKSEHSESLDKALILKHLNRVVR